MKEDEVNKKILKTFRSRTFSYQTEKAILSNIGERTNVAGSQKVFTIDKEEKFDEALEVARASGRWWSTNY